MHVTMYTWCSRLFDSRTDPPASIQALSLGLAVKHPLWSAMGVIKKAEIMIKKLPLARKFKDLWRQAVKSVAFKF